MGAHVSAVPNHQVGRSASLKARFHAAMSGNLGLELDPTTMTDAEKEFTTEQIALYKEIRHVIQDGRYQLLRNPKESNWPGWMFTSADGSEIVAFAFQKTAQVRMPIPRLKLQGLDEDVPVVYAGTFSNVMFPAIRIGYLVVPRALVTPFARAKWLADRHSPLLEQAALSDFMADGHLERHIRRTRRAYGRRRQALLDALARHFGDAAAVRGDAAGMHALVHFDAPDLARRAERARVRLLSAAPYYLSGRAPHEFLLGFSAVSERAIREGIRRLAG